MPHLGLIVCRQTSSIELPAQIAVALLVGALVRDLLPMVLRPEREQLVSGTQSVCWVARVGDDGEGD